jgi:hypothetical protein
MDTREDIEFIEQYGVYGVMCDRCGEPTNDSCQYEEVLDGLYCQDCAERVKEENMPVMYCDNCGLYFMDKSDKCLKCGEVDSEVFYTLSMSELEEYWRNGGDVCY